MYSPSVCAWRINDRQWLAFRLGVESYVSGPLKGTKVSESYENAVTNQSTTTKELLLILLIFFPVIVTVFTYVSEKTT
jgi:hypothetical protein